MPRLNRSVSMERLQDLATYFSPIPSMGVSEMPYPPPPPPHYTGYSYQSSASAMPPSAQHAAQYGQAAAAAATLAPPPPPPHHGHGHGHGHGHHAAAMLHANSTLGDLCSAAAAGGQPHYGHNLGSAVTSSMHLTNSSHDADGAAAAAAAAAAHAGSNYKMEHEMMYYAVRRDSIDRYELYVNLSPFLLLELQNTSSDMNHTDGFINSIFNDEDLHLMDMTESK